MSKDIKEYLRYYYGQECIITAPDGIKYSTPDRINEYWIDRISCQGGEIQPILRKLESMAEDELQSMMQHFSRVDLSKCTFEHSGRDEKWANAIENGHVIEAIDINLNNHMVMMMDEFREVTITLPQSETFHYLLSRGFDLFQLIENGLAIDKETLNR